MSLISRLEDAIRATIREAVPGITEEQIAVLEPRLVDLFIEYAAEHFKLLTRGDEP